MKRMSLRSFVARVAAAAIISLPLPALNILGIDAAKAQTTKSQTVSKEVATAIQQEQQAAQLAARGRTAEAEALYKQSLAAMEAGLPDDPILAGSLNNVAQFYRAQRRFPEAADLLNRALAIYVARYGDNNTLTATAINNLAGTYLADRKFDAAEPFTNAGLRPARNCSGRSTMALPSAWITSLRPVSSKAAIRKPSLT
jgi:tetratricopeptide (TPR) repeat protein